MGIDVLNLEWTSNPSRDRLMATLVCNYLRYIGYSVIEGSIFDGFNLIHETKPRVLFLSDNIGADNNVEIMKYAYYLGIPAVNLISEGNIKNNNKELVTTFFWGWNEDRILYENIKMLWSERSKAFVLQYFPELSYKIKVSGGVGFDNYKIATKVTKQSFLKKYNKLIYKKLVGIGCWDFGIFYEEDSRYNTWIKFYSINEINRFKKDQLDFNRTLDGIIKNNPDICFLLKEHPGVLLGNKASGIMGLDRYENTIILKNEESIIDCINASDFWVIYESTTALEAWLSDKQTCLLNPSGIDFPRENIHKGSPNAKTENELQNIINYFYNRGSVLGFNELEKERKNIISETIQWDDGLNHVRAGNEVIEILNNHKKSRRNKESFSMFSNRLIQHMKWQLSKPLRYFHKFKNHYKYRRNFNPKKLLAFQKSRLNEQLIFYKKINLSKNDLRQVRCI